MSAAITGDPDLGVDAVVADICHDASGMRGDVRDVVGALVDRRAPLAGPAERCRMIELAVARLAGLDVLEHHLHDPDVDEVMVNAGGDVWIDRGGRLVPAGRLPAGAVEVVVERVLAPTGRRVDRTSPIVDVRLPDGSRLCAVVDPVAVGGTALAIRRHRRRTLPITAFTRSADIAALLRQVVAARCNVLVSGATSSGKTSLVGALLAHATGDRLVVCEDTAELALDGHHAVRLEARPATADGPVAVDLARLVRTALRLRPDRLVVGEFRGVEVLAAVEAMNTGHDGSLSTCHANGALDALARMETLLMQAAPTWPLPANRRQVTRSLDVVVHVERQHDGSRRVAEVAEVVDVLDCDGEPAIAILADGRGVVRSLSRCRGAGAS
jgi:pilus assembly protein CpaF